MLVRFLTVAVLFRPVVEVNVLAISGFEKTKPLHGKSLFHRHLYTEIDSPRLIPARLGCTQCFTFQGGIVDRIVSQTQFSFLLGERSAVRPAPNRAVEVSDRQCGPESVNYLGGPHAHRISKPGGGPQLRINC